MKDGLRIARNAPCPCKSGKRYKHCHGAASSRFPAGISEAEVRHALSKQEARELLRKREQGHGRPIISFTQNGHRFVAVGKRLAVSSKWQYFNQFLLDNMKDVMGRQWGADGSRLMPDHPLFRWLEQLTQTTKKAGPNVALPVVGFMSALIRFCYALYLIEHNDKPPKSLIKRLKNPVEFTPACYEAIVASAFAIAGAKIDGAEDGKGGGSKPEFVATFESGQRYAVEAKRRQGWKNAFDLADERFVTELKGWLRGKLHAASKKKLAKPVYWFELGIGASLSSQDVERLRDVVADGILEAEDLTVEGGLAQPAYVFVTNNSDFANDDAVTSSFFCVFQGFRMEDFRESLVDFETAMDWHDRHRPVRRVLECMEEVQQVPSNFDGVPSELLDDLGRPMRLPQIGDPWEYQRSDGTDAKGVITAVSGFGEHVHLAIFDAESSKSFIVKAPLSKQAARAVKRLGNAIFGTPEGPRNTSSSPYQLYDRMIEMLSGMSSDYLLKQLGNKDEYRLLQRDGLVTRAAREMTKSLLSLQKPAADNKAALE